MYSARGPRLNPLSLWSSLAPMQLKLLVQCWNLVIKRCFSSLGFDRKEVLHAARTHSTAINSLEGAERLALINWTDDFYYSPLAYLS